MAQGNRIVISPDPQGIKLEGTITGTPSPGTMMEIDPAVTTFVNGKPNYRVFQRGSDGQNTPVIIADIQPLNGALATTAYAAGDHGFFYVPQPGEDMNILVKALTGTGYAPAIGDFFIANSGTGKFVHSTGSPNSEPFQLMQSAVAAEASDFLLWALATGR